MKPIIGITCNYRDSHVDNAAGVTGVSGQDFYALADDYIKSVTAAGGIPVILPITSDESMIDSYIELCDGFIIAGGNDIAPELYGEPIINCGQLVLERDIFDIKLAQRVYQRCDKPVLGICRGCQIINVAFGGTLYQDVVSEGYRSHRINSYPRNFISHQVDVSQGSLLFNIVKEEKIGVNSYHHQAIKQIAANAECAAVSQDGLIESLYFKEKKFYLGVQWHPEMMFNNVLQKKIFNALIENSKKKEE